MEDDNSDVDFKHFMHLASGVLVLRIDGVLKRSSREDLSKIHEEVLALDFSHLVLNLMKVRQVDPQVYRFIVQLQSFVRGKIGGKVRVIPPPSHIKERLANEGILKREEVFNDLKLALQSI